MLEMQSSSDAYSKAQRQAKASYMENVSAGRSGYLPSLDGLISNTEVASEVNLGTVEVPLNKVIGTYSHSRSSAFAPNFLPLPPEDSEFAHKWQSLFTSHMKEGIRDSVIAYEYLNWFYIREGNKRTSILKYSDAASISAEVRRLIPRKDDSDITNRIYFEFLEFNRVTKINSVWFSEEGCFAKLLDYMERYEGEVPFNSSLYQSFMANVYMPFRVLYRKEGGKALKITTGDALLKFLEIYGPLISLNENSKDDARKIEGLLEELKHIESHAVSIVTKPVKDSVRRDFFSTLTGSKKDLINVAFVYSKEITTSGWTYAHELGRLHIANVFGDQVNLAYVENVPENNDAYDYIKKLAEDGNEVIFTTSPTYLNPTLKAALEYPKVKFFTCAEANSYKNVVTFFGRIHEPKYLLGIIAGSLTKTNKIGYIATYPIPEIIESINAFALGAKLVNPFAEVHVKWINKREYCGYNPELIEVLNSEGVDIIKQDSLPYPGDKSRAYGLFSAGYDESEKIFIPKSQYAITIWHWGVFYEKVIRTILNGTWGAAFGSSGAEHRPVNFWWGIDSGLVDVFYSLTHVPRETQRLIDFIKKMIIQNEFNVFNGPIYDRDGVLRVAEEQTATFEQIFTMDWLVDNVRGDIPEIPQDPDPLTEQYGVRGRS